STYNVYGNEPMYDETYRQFLGPRQLPPGRSRVDGYDVHRLPTRLVGGYVQMKALTRTVASIRPDIVHSIEIASLPTFELAAAKPFLGYKLFCETHQNVSVMKPYMRNNGAPLKRAGYRLTRTLPTHLASYAVETCYAVAAD